MVSGTNDPHGDPCHISLCHRERLCVANDATGSASSSGSAPKGCVWPMTPRDRRVPRAQRSLDLAAVSVSFPSVLARLLTHTISPERAAHRSGNTIEAVWILFVHPTGRPATSTWIRTRGRVGLRRTLRCCLGALFVVRELARLSGYPVRHR